jgi:hypothetical protein
LYSDMFVPLATSCQLPAREKEREEKRLKKEQAAESKKRKAGEAAGAKKAARPASGGRRRKSKRGQHEGSAESDDPDRDQAEGSKARSSRTRGEF